MSRKPDYRVDALNKKTDEKSIVGAGWANPDNTISVTLYSFIRLEGGKDLLVTLFPNTDKEESPR